jgi:maltose/maltodextrin transport system permease protein
MALFVVWPLVYTAYVSLTNWQTGNVLTKAAGDRAGSSRDPCRRGSRSRSRCGCIGNSAGGLRFLVEDPEGTRYFGEPRFRTDEPLEDPLEDPEALGVVDADGDGVPESIGDFRSDCCSADLIAIAGDLERLVLDVPGRGHRPGADPDLRPAHRGDSALRLRPRDRRPLRRPDAVVTCVAGVGQFVCDGRAAVPDRRGRSRLARGGSGSTTTVAIFTNPRIREPFVKVFTWNVVFAFLSVVFTFSLGLLLVQRPPGRQAEGEGVLPVGLHPPLRHPRLHLDHRLAWPAQQPVRPGQPGSSPMIGIDAIPWLIDPFWAKVAVLLVNTMARVPLHVPHHGRRPAGDSR